MIQRIQSIFLLLAGAGSLSLFLLPFATSNEAISTSAILNDSVFNLNDNIGMLIAFALAGILSLVAIFLFKNRKNQMLLSRIAFIANLIGMVMVVLFFFNDPATQSTSQVTDAAGAYMPILAMILNLVALRFIGKDEKKVQSMDRLR